MSVSEVNEWVRSLLLSTPHGLTVREFLSDYKKMIGQEFPYRKYNYKTPQDFLANMPTVVKISYSAGERILTAVASEETSHIQKLVAKQKTIKKTLAYKRRYPNYPVNPIKSPTNSFSGRRNVYVPPRMRTQEMQAKPNVSKVLEGLIIGVLRSKPNGIKTADFNRNFRDLYGYTLDPGQHGYKTVEELLFGLPDIVTVQNRGKYLLARAKNADQVVPAKNEDEQIECEDLANNCDEMVDNGDEENVYMDSAIEAVNNNLKSELQKVIERHPKGLSCILLPAEYKTRFGKDLNFQELGFSSIMELVSALPDVFFVSRPSRGAPWVLYDARTHKEGNLKSSSNNASLEGYRTVDVPPYVKRKITEVLTNYPYGIFLNEILEKYQKKHREKLDYAAYGYPSIDMLMISLIDDVIIYHKVDVDTVIIKLLPGAFDQYASALPVTSYSRKENTNYEEMDEIELPEDVVLPGVKFKVQDVEVPNSSDPYIEVRVSQVVKGPEHFYIQLIGDETTERLEELMNELETYNYLSSRDYKVHPEHLVKGLVCAALYEDGNWHRACIDDIKNETDVVVSYVDYGTVDEVKKDKLRYLKKKFLDFPTQAIKTRLANIQPAHNASEWSVMACKRFYTLSVHKTKLLAWIINKKIDPVTNGPELYVCLCDMSTGNEIHINDCLIQEGLAEMSGRDGIAPQIAPQIALQNVPSLDPASSLEYYKTFHGDLMLPQAASMCFPLLGNVQGSYLPTGPSYVPANGLNGYPLSGLNSNVSLEMLLQGLQLGAVPFANGVATVTPPGMVNPRKKPASRVNSTAETGEETSLEDERSEVINNNNNNNIVDGDMSMINELNNLTSSDNDSGSASPRLRDEVLERLSRELDQIPSPKKHYVKFVKLTERHSAHLILYRRALYMTSLEISKFMWNRDYLRNMLRVKSVKVASVIVSETDEPELFEELKRYHLCNENVYPDMKTLYSELPVTQTLYPLESVLEIIKAFNPKLEELYKAIKREKRNFSPNDTFWGLYNDESFPSSTDLDSFLDEELEQKLSLNVFKNHRNLLQSKLSKNSNTNLQKELKFINERISSLESFKDLNK